MQYANRKLKRVVRSGLDADIFAFAEASDVAVMLRYDEREIFRRDLPLCVLNGRSNHFLFVVNSTTTTEKWMILDLHAPREAFITEIGWIGRELYIDDSLLKTKRSPPMSNFLANHTLDRKVLRWVMRAPSTYM